MTDTSFETASSTSGTARRPQLARCWLVGGALWLAAGLVFDSEGWRFDLGSVLWLVADLAIALGIVGLMQARPHGASRVGSIALVVALVARVAFAGGEITSLIQGTDESPLIPIGSMLTALSMVAYGVVVVRRNVAVGAGRWAPLTVGLYPFVAMFPVLAATGEPSYLLIGLWGIPMAGVAATLQPKPAAP